MATLFEVNKGSIDGAEVSFNDVDQLLKAKSDASFQKLIHHYSLNGLNLFGTQIESVGLGYETSVNDCKSMQSLLNAGLRLSRLVKNPLLIYEDVGLYTTAMSVIEVSAKGKEQDGLSLTIPLSGGKGAGTFLKAGIGKASLNVPALKVSETNNEPKSLSLLSYAITDNPEDMLTGLFDALSKIMLNDLSTVVRVNKIVVTSCSLASSLWLAFLETLRTGEIITCAECGAPSFAPPKRKNQRKFCSDRCRQAHYRKMQRD